MIRLLNKMHFISKFPIVNRIAYYCIKKYQLLYYGRVVIKKINGITYVLDLSEMIDSSLYFYGYYERNTSRVLREYIKQNMTVFEVGANIGSHTFEIAKILDPSHGRLFSFEPTDYAFGKLKRNFGLNNFTNITLEKIALADKNEEREIHRATSSETMPFKASWDRKKGGPKYKSIDKIKFERLDDYFARNNVRRLDLLKIDVDGYELRVIKGGMQTISMYKPIIIIEIGETVERIGDHLDELVEALWSFRYSIYSNEPQKIKFTEKDILIEAVKKKRTIDCICLPA